MKRSILIVLVVLLLSGLTASVLALVAPPESVGDSQAMITAELLEMGVLDAEPWESEFVQNSYREAGLDVLFYYSESTGMRYTFDAQSGELISFVKLRDSAPSSLKADMQTNSEQKPWTDDQRRTAALAYMEKDLADSIIGELCIYHENSGGSGDSNYTVLEYYNGIPTGTNAFIVVDEYGQIVMYSSGVGSVFTRNGDGSVVMMEDEPLIDEGAAMQTAVAAVQADAQDRSLDGVAQVRKCGLLAAGGTLYYDLELLLDREDAYDYSYKVSVNAHTGEILRLLKSA